MLQNEAKSRPPLHVSINIFIADRQTKVVKIVTGNTRAYSKYNVYCLIILISSYLLPISIWIQITIQSLSTDGAIVIYFLFCKGPMIPDHSCSESKVLGLSLTCYKCYLDIGIMTIESVPHSLQRGDTLKPEYFVVI